MTGNSYPYGELGASAQDLIPADSNSVKCSIKRISKILIIPVLVLFVYSMFKYMNVEKIQRSHGNSPSDSYSTDSMNEIHASITNINTMQSKDSINAIEKKGNESKPVINVTCSTLPSGLVGPIQVNVTEVSMKDVEQNNETYLLDPGGHYSPAYCIPNYRVAILIPYRNRESHLAIFLNNMHKFLMKHEIEYQIYVIEQMGEDEFNRAALLNIGFVEALRDRPYWDCFILHDVDKLPMDDRNLYTCPTMPRHLSAAIDIDNFKLPYPHFFGGVTAITTKQFITVNGFSNKFWGWGGEDDDFYNRMKYHNFTISRYTMDISRYKSFDHDRPPPNPKRYELLRKGTLLYDKEGLNSLVYTLNKTTIYKLYTNFLVEIKKDL